MRAERRDHLRKLENTSERVSFTFFLVGRVTIHLDGEEKLFQQEGTQCAKGRTHDRGH